MSRVRLVLLSVFAALVVSVAVSASASALEFYKCVKVAPGAGKYENSNCVKEGGSKEFELELLKESLKIVSKQTEPYIMEVKVSGVTVEIKCEKAKATGLIDDGLTGKDLEPGKGTKILTGLGYISNELEACTVPKPAGQECEIVPPIPLPVSIQTSANVGTFLLYSILVSVEIVLQKCKTTALNGAFPVEGMVAGQVNNATSTLSFKNEEPNKKLLIGGNAAKFVGGSSFEMEGGGFINAHSLTGRLMQIGCGGGLIQLCR